MLVNRKNQNERNNAPTYVTLGRLTARLSCVTSSARRRAHSRPADEAALAAGAGSAAGAISAPRDRGCGLGRGLGCGLDRLHGLGCRHSELRASVGLRACMPGPETESGGVDSLVLVLPFTPSEKGR